MSTVNIAARVQGLAEAGEIYITQDVHAYPGVPDAFAGYVAQSEQAAMKGVSEKMGVYKIMVQNQENP
jgi:class 3 adenylate cyclase